MKYAGLIGAGLGFVAFGPIGAIIGFGIGSFVQKRGARKGPQTAGGDFTMSMLVLSAAVIKADGRIEKSELDYVKQFFIKQFGPTHIDERMQLLADIIKKDYSLRQVSLQIKLNTTHATRLQMIQYLFGISQADGHVHPLEVDVIAKISSYIGVSLQDMESIKAMFVKDTNSYYKILEVEPNASDYEIRKAYRRMASKYHPDKLAHLGPEFQNGAQEKFVKVNEAYAALKKERGMK